MQSRKNVFIPFPTKFLKDSLSFSASHLDLRTAHRLGTERRRSAFQFSCICVKPNGEFCRIGTHTARAPHLNSDNCAVACARNRGAVAVSLHRKAAGSVLTRCARTVDPLLIPARPRGALSAERCACLAAQAFARRGQQARGRWQGWLCRSQPAGHVTVRCRRARRSL